MQLNACVHRLDLGLNSHPKEFLGNRVRTQVNSKGKSPLQEKFSSEEDRTHHAASSRTASPTHYQRAIHPPLPPPPPPPVPSPPGHQASHITAPSLLSTCGTQTAGAGPKADVPFPCCISLPNICHIPLVRAVPPVRLAPHATNVMADGCLGLADGETICWDISGSTPVHTAG